MWIVDEEVAANLGRILIGRVPDFANYSHCSIAILRMIYADGMMLPLAPLRVTVADDTLMPDGAAGS
jgi:hypothetical protein